MILIVDDHIDTSTALVRLLSKCGQQAVAVASGEAALALLETCTPSLIVLDMMMPGCMAWRCFATCGASRP